MRVTPRTCKPRKPGTPTALILGGHVQALGLVRSLGMAGIPVHVVEETPLCIARYSRYCTSFSYLAGLSRDDSIAKWLTLPAQLHSLGGAVILATGDAVVAQLARNTDILGTHYRLCGPDPEAVATLLDKRLTYQLAAKCAIPFPRTLFARDPEAKRLALEHLGYPFIIKPAVMHTFYSKLRTKAVVVKSASGLESELARIGKSIEPSELMFQQLVPGTAEQLYSCCCLAREGELVATLVARRSRQIPMDFGKSTTYAETVEEPVLVRYSSKLLRELNYTGLAEVEFKCDPATGIFKLLEINPRSWKWHSIAGRAGLDLPLLAYQQAIGEVIQRQPQARTGVRWIDIYPDTYVAVKEILNGRLHFRDYTRSLDGEVEHAVASLRDPAPFLAYTLLLPYMLASR